MTGQLRASYLFPLLLAGFVQASPKTEKTKMYCYKDVKGTIYDYGATTLNGREYIQFRQYAGKHVLFVNVATYCGLTAQYPGFHWHLTMEGMGILNVELHMIGVRPVEKSIIDTDTPSPASHPPSELNALQEELKPFGLVVLGFPCNQFGKQEPGDNSEILPGLKYVRPGGGYVPNFQLFEKGYVNGDKEQRVFTFLKHSCPHPSEILGSSRYISWEPMKVHDIRWNFEKFLVGPDGVPVMRWYHRTSVSTVRVDILEHLKLLKAK